MPFFVANESPQDECDNNTQGRCLFLRGLSKRGRQKRLECLFYACRCVELSTHSWMTFFAAHRNGTRLATVTTETTRLTNDHE